MTDQEILTTFTRILRDLLDDESIVLTMETRRTDVPNWDSFGYVTFIAAAEMQFGIKFRIADVESFATVGDIVAQTRTLLQK
jgi:acyl carrier protein